VNGRGAFLSAQNPDELVSSLRDIMQSIESRIASSASISVNGDQLYGIVGSNILMFQSTYNPDGWSGDVKAYQVDTATGNVITTSYIWSGADELDSLTWTSRRIATCNSTGDTGRPFAWDQLDVTQKGYLNNDETILNFLKGDRSNETQYGGTLRNRYTILGDIVHSSAIFENEYLYVGANDGMLHCLNASTGVEQFAYVPNLIFDKLANLADPAYGSSHQYYVDLSPTVQPDVNEGGTTITLLVGGLGGGGKGYYALDVTDPSTMTSDSQVANKVKWEFSGHNDLGFTYAKPTIVPSNDDDVNKNNTNWVVITGNSYNSQNGNAVLFILDPVDGSVIKTIDVGNGPCNGLSTPAAVDADSDGMVDYVYAGDLKGNLWKFDLTDTSYLNWDVAFKDGTTPKPLFRCPGQPITTQPDVMVHCEKHGYMVVFGTGKYIEGDDPADSSMQSIYGVWDYGDDDDDSEYLGTFIRGAVPQLSNQPGTVTLVRQSIVPSNEADPNFWTQGDTKLRILTENAPDWTTTSKLADNTCGLGLGEEGCDPNGVGANPDPLMSAGWYFDLPISGEKVISDALIRAEKVIVISFVSEDDPCGSGGDSIVHEIDACSGARLATPQFDIDNSGNVGSGDLINIGTAENPVYVAPAGVMREGRLQPPAILRLTNPKDEEMKYYSSSTGEIRQEQGPSVGLGMSHWREYR
jgi:type IV pilus assembly protein PilY1